MFRYIALSGSDGQILVAGKRNAPAYPSKKPLTFIEKFKMSFLKAALDYAKKGFSVIPLLPGDKKAAVPWSEYQNRHATPEEIAEWWHQYPKANIGIVTGKISDLTVIDLDKYKKEYDPSVEIDHFDNLVTPCAQTPKGGLHLYCSFCEGITVATGVLPAVDVRGEGGYIVAPPSQNGSGSPYKWIISLDEVQRAAPPASFLELALINKSTLYRGVSKQDVSKPLTDANTAYRYLHEGNRNADIFSIANALAKGGLKFELASEVIKIIANNTTPPYNLKEAYESLKSAYNRKESRERNIHDEIREYILAQKSLQEAYISLTSCLQSLQLLTRQEKSVAYTAFNRLCNVEKLIEKHGDKRGEYRILNNEKDKAKMDLFTESEITEVPVKLPINLNDLCVISPGNICVVAGSKSAGKTALLMNIAWANQHGFKIVYLNSEMHESEFKKRMKKFAPLSKWKITGYSCHNNFDDYIESDPNTIYIVDYLEVHDNFYEIAKPIRKIHEKLGDAICFIGIQMKVGASLGRGGDFSAEKARLYLTMDYNGEEKRTKVTIYDAKEPRPPFNNVRGKWRHVKILEGNRLEAFAEWQW